MSQDSKKATYPHIHSILCPSIINPLVLFNSTVNEVCQINPNILNKDLNIITYHCKLALACSTIRGILPECRSRIVFPQNNSDISRNCLLCYNISEMSQIIELASHFSRYTRMKILTI